MIRKFIAIFAIFILLFAPSFVVAANANSDEQWSMITDQSTSGQELLGVNIQDDTTALTSPSVLNAIMDRNNTPLSMHLCTSMKDSWCAGALMFAYTAILEPCATDAAINCVAGISSFDASGKETSGSLVRKVPQVGWSDFAGDPSINLATGSTASLWTLPGVTHGGKTDQYLVSAKVHAANNDNAGSFTISDLNVAISPVVMTSDPRYGRMHAHDGKNADPNCAAKGLPCGMATDGSSAISTNNCAAIEDGACAIKQGFPTGVRFSVKLRLGNSPTGWFHGRLKSPEATFNSLAHGVELTMAAEPVVVPVVGVLEARTKLPANILNYYDTGKANDGAWTWGEPGPTGRRNQLFNPEPSSPLAFEQFQLWTDYFKDKANASPTVWNFKTMQTTPETASCFRNDSKLIGIVTTNSMMYSAGPPVFNNGSLDYKVGSPHFTSVGDVFKGTYDLQIRSDVARCLYNFTAAPLKAKISISSESGAENVATTVVEERNDWLRLSAYGFTFSNPTVRVKLTQDAPTPVASPSPTATVAPQPAPTATSLPAVVTKKITINCAKGKTIKKVTSVKPVCPKGYAKVNK